MKKTYEAPEAQIVSFETENVLKASGTGDGTGGGINTPFYPV